MLFNVIILLSFAGLSLGSDAWSHHDEESWPGKCGNGEAQSPINIRPHETLPDPHQTHIRGELNFRGYENVQVRAQNTGYKVMWAAVPGQPAPVLSGGPLRGNYTFAEMHIHWLSEHAVNGVKYPLEVHIVHLKYGLTLAEAQLLRDGIAVIGVFGQVVSEGNSSVLGDLLPAMDYILTRSEPSESVFNIDLTQLLTSNPQAYYTYHGSLTTPDCPEVVTWIVMENPISVAHAYYKNLTRADMNGINNDRAVQPLGQRLVYRSPAASACARLAPSLLGSLAALATCFGSKMATSFFSFVCNIKKKFLGTCKSGSPLRANS